MAVELDECLGGVTVQHREMQGHETQSFFRAFDGRCIEYLEGSGHAHEPPQKHPRRLLQVSGKLNTRVTPCDLGAPSLAASDVVVLDLGDTLIQWNGEASTKKERIRGLEFCQSLSDERRLQGEVVMQLVVVQQKKPMASDAPPDAATLRFWQELGADSKIVQPPRPSLQPRQQESTKLWRLAVVQTDDGKKKLQVTEILDRPLTRWMLDPSQVFLVAAPDALWVWMGTLASQVERQKSMLYAQSFLQVRAISEQLQAARVEHT